MILHILIFWCRSSFTEYCRSYRADERFGKIDLEAEEVRSRSAFSFLFALLLFGLRFCTTEGIGLQLAGQPIQACFSNKIIIKISVAGQEGRGHGGGKERQWWKVTSQANKKSGRLKSGVESEVHCDSDTT